MICCPRCISLRNVLQDSFLIFDSDNNQGKLGYGFPISGTTPFVLTDFFGDYSSTLIVGNRNIVYAYKCWRDNNCNGDQFSKGIVTE